MALPTPVVDAREWNAAREALLVEEKKLTRARDAVAAQRRRLPLVKVEKDYEFEGPAGKSSLLDLFEGRSQLIVYRFFLDPGMSSYPQKGCPGCSMFADNLPNALEHLLVRDTTLVFASGGEQEAVQRYREHMGWSVPWYTTRDDFSQDFDVPEYFGINVFLRDGEDIYRSYFTTARSAEELSSVWALLDLTPFGRQESWQEAPDAVPQGEAYSWGKRHDEYSAEELAGAVAPSGAAAE